MVEVFKSETWIWLWL